MTYSAKAVANYFLKRGFEEDVSISPMKLQKLLYYAQGWHLGITKKPIIDEQIECWPYGPVINSIFHEFKSFGAGAISTNAEDCDAIQDKGTGRWRILREIPELPPTLDENSRAILDAVWDAYKGFSATKLSNMTHVPGGPWHQVYMAYNGDPPRGTDISMDVITTHFAAQLTES